MAKPKKMLMSNAPMSRGFSASGRFTWTRPFVKA